MSIVEINVSRLNYLLETFKLTPEELLFNISRGLKKKISLDEVFTTKIKVEHLKRIDSIFNKGIYFYLDPDEPKYLPENSIFFRKSDFTTPLNLASRKIVNQFEEERFYLSALAKLSDFNLDRTIPTFSIHQKPKIVAKLVRDKLYPDFNTNAKEFLKSLINKFANHNILIFEYVETWNKKEKTNIDGFFLSPNIIVLKRQQKAFKREIFSLIHELGHYLLNEEEIEELEYDFILSQSPGTLERWCNDFAFYFLIGEFIDDFENIPNVNASNDYYAELINEISFNTHLSKLALYTRLLLEEKLSFANYNSIKQEEEAYLERIAKENEQKLIDAKLRKSKRGGAPKPIVSPLFVKTVQIAFLEGVITEMEFCTKLKIKPQQISKYLQ